MSPTDEGDATDEPTSRPTLSVVRGNPSDAELVAVLAVVGGRVAGPSAAPGSAGSQRSGWSAYWRAVRAPLAPGPDAWRMSGRP